MKTQTSVFPILFILFLFSCQSEDDIPTLDIEVPETYQFTRDNQSTVDFEGQTTRIKMAEELISAMKNTAVNASLLLEMYSNQLPGGGDADPFSDATLNESSKSIRSKVAASADYYSANTVDAAAIKSQFEAWIDAQVTEVFANQNTLAEAGVAGQLADGTSTRYVNAQGIEYNQLVAKGLLGALMTDQILNNYLSPAVLDANDNRLKNDAVTMEAGAAFTTMEHYWDEAYGYLYGTAADLANPNPTIGDDDSFLNEYTGRVNDDPDFAGIAEEIFNAFKTGRAAIVAGKYDIRDEQIAILREKISLVIAVRAVHYLQQGKFRLENGDRGSAFHALSEALGFVYSLQFTRISTANSPYFTKTDIENLWSDLLGDGPNGLWDITPATLDAVSNTIANRFGFTVAMAAE